jgi:Zn-finger nucleic acid-binding protein
MIAVCPSCDKRMVAYVLDGVEIDACDHCGGLWLDEGEISELTDAARQPDLPTDALLNELRIPTRRRSGRPRLCPRCVTPLQELPLPKLAHCPATTLDCCPQGHGLFFDQHELGAMLRRHHGPESPLTQFLIRFFGPNLVGTETGPAGPTPSQSLEASQS